ncbi:MAG TPA: hypothetical protein VGO52_22190 [Hyphomonadaceae bacterium]|jgi:hypothetical protein|nr:hypothetical protein [Hyphomonadaceae bacterium]
MKLMIFAAAAMALTGCASVPVTQTAANDDACLQRSVQPSVEKLPITKPRQPMSTNCKNMGASWSGVGAPENRSFDPDFHPG